MVACICAFVFSPLAAVGSAHPVWAGVLALAGRRLNAPPLGHLLLPLGLLLVGLALSRSALLFRLRRGVIRRGTHYPAHELIAHQRVRR